MICRKNWRNWWMRDREQKENIKASLVRYQIRAHYSSLDMQRIHENRHRCRRSVCPWAWNQNATCTRPHRLFLYSPNMQQCWQIIDCPLEALSCTFTWRFLSLLHVSEGKNRNKSVTFVAICTRVISSRVNVSQMSMVIWDLIIILAFCGIRCVVSRCYDLFLKIAWSPIFRRLQLEMQLGEQGNCRENAARFVADCWTEIISLFAVQKGKKFGFYVLAFASELTSFLSISCTEQRHTRHCVTSPARWCHCAARWTSRSWARCTSEATPDMAADLQPWTKALVLLVNIEYTLVHTSGRSALGVCPPLPKSFLCFSHP